MWIFLAAVGVALLLASSAKADQPGTRTITNTGYDPNDPLASWKKAMDEAAKAPQLPPNEQAEHDFWVDFYKKKGHTYIPPEYPIDPAEVGAAGDIVHMPRADQQLVVQALFEEPQADNLFALAADVEEAGYPVAAARLKRKAFRMIETT